jgi:pyruvate/2-oxoglutarate dehydrogenase complex dihydrolipoamide acyltransferase (E2) component
MAADITMPKWGMSMQEAYLAEWLVSVGDSVTEGQPVAAVETEKVDAVVEAPAAGIVEELLVEEGSDVPVGMVIARLS